jgi:hypothetical protein
VVNDPGGWGLISEPVSRDNEADVCATLIGGCEAALQAYTTRVWLG